jgi:hypothetical protein
LLAGLAAPPKATNKTKTHTHTHIHIKFNDISIYNKIKLKKSEQANKTARVENIHKHTHPIKETRHKCRSRAYDAASAACG